MISYGFRLDNLYHPADLFVNGRIRMANYEKVRFGLEESWKIVYFPNLVSLNSNDTAMGSL